MKPFVCDERPRKAIYETLCRGRHPEEITSIRSAFIPNKPQKKTSKRDNLQMHSKNTIQLPAFFNASGADGETMDVTEPSALLIRRDIQ